MDRATSLVKALDLLTLLGGSTGGMAAQQLADAMNLPRSTVMRIINTLVEYGLVARRGRLYGATEAFGLWATQDRHAAFRHRYRRVLEEVAAAVGELVLLGVQDGAGVVHIDYIESDQAVRVAPAPATRHGLRRTAAGKLCLAMRPDLAERWIREDPAFAAELEEIRASGIAWNREESVPGMVALAGYGFSRAPTEPKIVVAWPVHRFSKSAGDQARQALRDALA